jgi:Flp pilus assembly protein TadG
MNAVSEMLSAGFWCMSEIASWCSSCFKDRRGGVALVFGLAITVMFGAVGFAVDFSRAHAARQSAQGAMDAAMMSAARKEAISEQIVEDTMETYLSLSDSMKHGATAISTVGRVLDNGATVEGEVVMRVPTRLLNVMGYGYIDVKVESRVMRGLGNVEIALVLDTTKSMEGSRLASVKTAASQLVDTLFALPDASSKVKVSVVPFAQYVNVGMDNRYASWMDVPADSSTTTTSCYDTYPNAVKSNCRMATYSATSDGVPYTYTVEECDWDYGTAVGVCAPYTTTNSWNGCAGARSNPLNIKDEQYSSRIPGIRNVSCPSKILPLSKSASDIKDNINAMVAHGDTYIPSGLVWGWRSLSNRGPFTESADDAATANGSVRKYLVLMTDGFNTRSPRYPDGDHEGTDPVAANQLTRATCDNIKADSESKIEIYTIAFEVADEGVKDILRHCATPGGAFFDAVDYSKLLTAFSEIGNSVSVARLAK